VTPRARRERQDRERIEERGEAVDRKTRDRCHERQRDAEGVRREAYWKQPALFPNATRRRSISDEPLIVGRVEKDTGEGHCDEDRTKSVDDERRGGTLLGEDVPADQRGGKRDDPNGDQQQEVQVQKSPVDAPAVLEEGVVIHPDDADGEEAHEVGGIRWPQPDERGAQIGRVLGHAELEYEERCRDREDAVAECFEPTRAHTSSLNEPEER